MKLLITGSSGHLGEALMRTLANGPHEAVGVDMVPSPFTSVVGSIVDRAVVDRCMKGVDAVLHTATLHKPHVATHPRQAFVDTNITGTLNLLEASIANQARSFVFTSTTSTFGDALTPPARAPAAWITEDVVPIPKNIYGATKVAAEDLCQLFHRNQKLPCLILRTSRFFPEEDDVAEKRAAFADANLKGNEFLYRRVDVADVVSSHLLAVEKAATIGFGKFIVTATTPFERDDLEELGMDAPAVLRRRVPAYEAIYAALGWKMLPALDRVYVNQRAREVLGWMPQYDFAHLLRSVSEGKDPRSELAQAIGSKGYHHR
ncbi:MAG TPA: NAD(P)-dependent oxidoreductase [Steroidobacteraceae bacterium]|jgi:UDP-glucose 4-epimerase|nr:NAD(P)-dependent oxidoreductase [Steroidobacteraceae bacterium]